MASVVTSIFALSLIMGSVLLLTWSSLSSANRVTLEWNSMAQRNGREERTEISLIAADILGSGDDIDISLRNIGQTAMRDFANWDVTIQYYATSTNQGLNIAWLPYTASSTPPSGKWTVTGLYLNASSSKPEVYDPNVFNHGEEMKLRVNISPQIPTSTDNLVTIGTPNGITVAAPFSR